jgi:IS5 family transposase
LGLPDKGPEETPRGRFRQRLVKYGRHEKLLGLVNRQLEQKGLILKTCTRVDATRGSAARRAPRQENKTGGEPEVGFTVRGGRPHAGDKAPGVAAQAHPRIRRGPRTEASVPDRQEFATGVPGEEQRVGADKV